MPPFASRDLMVASLPLEGEWAADADCGDCTKCTDKSDKPDESFAGDADLPALQAQLRRATALAGWRAGPGR